MFASKNPWTSPASPHVRHLVDRSLERAHVLGRELRHGEPHGHRLERLAHLVRLDELVARERADDGASPRPDRHEALGREPAERLADRAAADAERLGERDLGQLGPRRQPPGEDLVAKVVVDALPERAAVERGCCGRLAGDSLLAVCIERRRVV